MWYEEMNVLNRTSIVLLFVLVIASLGCIEPPDQEFAQTEVDHYCSYDPNYGYIYVVYSENETGNRTVIEVHIDRNLHNQAPKKYWADYEAKHGIKIKPLTPEEAIECLN